jgi:hypothetical protein
VAPRRGPAGKPLEAAAPAPATPSAAMEAMDGRALLAAARSLLGELARCARQE